MNIHIYRAASKGKMFTRREKENLIAAEQAYKARRAIAAELIMGEKRKIAAEREQKQKAREIAEKVFNFKKENPGAAVKRKKDGSRYVQLRGEKGRMMPAVMIA